MSPCNRLRFWQNSSIHHILALSSHWSLYDSICPNAFQVYDTITSRKRSMCSGSATVKCKTVGSMKSATTCLRSDTRKLYLEIGWAFQPSPQLLLTIRNIVQMTLLTACMTLPFNWVLQHFWKLNLADVSYLCLYSTETHRMDWTLTSDATMKYLTCSV